MAISFCKKNGKYVDRILQQKQIKEIKKEIFRKLIHLCAAFIPFLLNIFYWPIIVLLSLVLCFYIVCEILRTKGINVPLISKITDIASRKRDENHFVLGPVTLVLGILITALCFDPLSAEIGIFALALGDGLASLFGKLFGHVHIPFTQGKTVAGSLTCFIAIYISTFLCTKNPLCALVVAFVGMVIEVFPLKNLDNIALPICTAFVAMFFL